MAQEKSANSYDPAFMACHLHVIRNKTYRNLLIIIWVTPWSLQAYADSEGRDKWVAPWKNLSSGICGQLRPRQMGRSMEKLVFRHMRTVKAETNGSLHGKTCLQAYADSEGRDKWVTPCKNLSSGICRQRRPRQMGRSMEKLVFRHMRTAKAETNGSLHGQTSSGIGGQRRPRQMGRSIEKLVFRHMRTAKAETNESLDAKTCLQAYADSEGRDKPSLIRAFTLH